VEILSHWIEDHAGKVFSLQHPFSIGRSSDNTYVIASERVSRRHALVQARAAGEFWLTDLGSRNGVFLNRQPLQQSVRLKGGDVFQIADCQFVFHAQELREVTSEASTHAEMTMADQQTINSWILIADIIGSVRQAQAHDPNIWTGKVGTWIGECRTVLEESGGTMNKFLGDGFLSFWSSERTSPAEVVAALEKMISLQKSSALPFRFVVHYGPVQFVGISRGEISLTGNAVNFAFRLEKVASGLGKIAVVTRAVIDSCHGLLAWENLGLQSVPSFVETIELFSPHAPAVEIES
jgi:pSer/pThr/pTyr-binding forkhead associated (FHA) protein